LIPVGVGALFAPQWMLQRRLGPLLLVASPKSLRPGDTVRWRAELTPRKSLDVEAVSVSLLGTEIAAGRSGTDVTTYRHELHAESTPCVGRGTLRAGTPLRLDGTFTIPRDAAASFDSEDNHVAWTVRLRASRSARVYVDAEAKLDVSA
jgi:hypothetical protein